MQFLVLEPFKGHIPSCAKDMRAVMSEDLFQMS